MSAGRATQQSASHVWARPNGNQERRPEDLVIPHPMDRSFALQMNVHRVLGANVVGASTTDRDAPANTSP
jgi:hypothetical protein